MYLLIPFLFSVSPLRPVPLRGYSRTTPRVTRGTCNPFADDQGVGHTWPGQRIQAVEKNWKNYLIRGMATWPSIDYNEDIFGTKVRRACINALLMDTGEPNEREYPDE